MTALGDHHRAGSGPPLLLIHGFSATWKTWSPLIEPLTRDFEVLAPTLPGHTGGAPLDPPRTIPGLCDRVEALLDEVGWRDPHVAGFSLGGWLALELAKRGRARSVTAIAPSGALVSRGPREVRRFTRLFRRSRASARAAGPLMPRFMRSARFRRLSLRDMMVHGDRLDADAAVQSSRDHAAMPAFDDILASFACEELVDLDRVTVPVHIWWGKRDRVNPVHHAPYLEQRLPEATFEYVDDAGHVPFWDAPDSVLRAIRETTAKANVPAGA
jgi:pimeloyl-ACP methyl ester carboxylesterase